MGLFTIITSDIASIDAQKGYNWFITVIFRQSDTCHDSWKWIPNPFKSVDASVNTDTWSAIQDGVQYLAILKISMRSLYFIESGAIFSHLKSNIGITKTVLLPHTPDTRPLPVLYIPGQPIPNTVRNPCPQIRRDDLRCPREEDHLGGTDGGLWRVLSLQYLTGRPKHNEKCEHQKTKWSLRFQWNFK